MLTFNGSNVWVTILAHKLALPGSGVKWKFQMGWQEGGSFGSQVGKCLMGPEKRGDVTVLGQW